MNHDVRNAKNPALEIDSVSYAYGEQEALQSVSLRVDTGELFALLGPNGSGKTTLFRILTTILAPQGGHVRVLGYDVRSQSAEVRRMIGVVFQVPSLDRKLTARENLLFQGRLYGLRGARLGRRVAEVLELVGLSARAHELVERFSGGMQRRLEIAKALLHEPRVLLLDEPTTGLDPTARREVIHHLETLRATKGVTAILTTHILEEADHCDRVAVIDRGRVVVVGEPQTLKAHVGREVLWLTSPKPAYLRSMIAEHTGLATVLVNGEVRIEVPSDAEGGGARLLVVLVETFPKLIESARIGHPTLEDVFVHFTGHRLEGITEPKIAETTP